MPARLTAALALTLVVGLATAGGRATARDPLPVVYGYPYAQNCPGAGLADVVDRWDMYQCNCTSYVAWALTANGQRTDWFIPGAMNAWNWPHVARLAGLVVDRRPAVGAVAVWPRVGAPFGHVAYVFGVEPRGGIDVAEYNLPNFWNPETLGFDVRSDVPAAGALFIHVPLRGSAQP